MVQRIQPVVRLLRKPIDAKSSWSACVPPGQGCGALEPSRHREPAVQFVHAVCPELEANLPAEHRWQAPRPPVGA